MNPVRSTPTIPLPVVRAEVLEQEVPVSVPRNCCLREPMPGGTSLTLVGYDGGGHPWVRIIVSLAIGEQKIASWARLIERESRDMPALLARSCPPLLGPRLIK